VTSSRVKAEETETTKAENLSFIEPPLAVPTSTFANLTARPLPTARQEGSWHLKGQWFISKVKKSRQAPNIST